MSDNKAILRANFINRRTGSVISSMPISNHIHLNLDMRQLADSFDFEFLFRRSEKIDLSSHDFVEFFFKLPSGEEFQVSCGFVETLAADTAPNSHRFQANGRDFLGQLFNLPFLFAKPKSQETVVQFAQDCLVGSYLNSYLKYKGRSLDENVISRGAYDQPILISELTDAKRGPVLQQTIESVYNVVYQDRFGRAVIYGQTARDDWDNFTVISEFGDSNVESMQFRSDYSKVYSSVRILYTGNENNVEYRLQSSEDVTNPEIASADIFNPEIRTYQTGDLVTAAPGEKIVLRNRMQLLAQSIMRKGNQNLNQYVVNTNKPFYQQSDGTRTWYEKGQVFYIKNQTRNFLGRMMLVGIQYTQSETDLKVQLMFIGVDTLV